MFFNFFKSIEKKRQALLKSLPDSPLKEFYKTPFPDEKMSWQEIVYMPLDFETTGLDPKKDSIISIGNTHIVNQAIKLQKSSHILVNPHHEIPESSAIIHGILDSTVKSAASLEEILPLFLKELAGKVVIAHFAHVEYKFLENACKKLYNAPFLIPIVDTLDLELRRFQMQNLPVYSGDMRLPQCRLRYGLPPHSIHNALSDAIAAGELFLAQMSYITGDSPTPIKKYLKKF